MALISVALPLLSRAGEARRSELLTATARPKASRAWGWLQALVASPRARPAARTTLFRMEYATSGTAIECDVISANASSVVSWIICPRGATSAERSHTGLGTPGASTSRSGRPFANGHVARTHESFADNPRLLGYPMLSCAPDFLHQFSGGNRDLMPGKK